MLYFIFTQRKYINVFVCTLQYRDPGDQRVCFQIFLLIRHMWLSDLLYPAEHKGSQKMIGANRCKLCREYLLTVQHVTIITK